MKTKTGYRTFYLDMMLYTLALTLGVGSVHAQLNCTTKKCVEVQVDPKCRNNGLQNNNQYLGAAFSLIRAEPLCLGQKSIGGTPRNMQNGTYRICLSFNDCPNTGVNGLPCSGSVMMYTGDPQPAQWNTVCSPGIS